MSTLIHNLTVVQLGTVLQEGESSSWHAGHYGEAKRIAREGWGYTGLPHVVTLAHGFLDALWIY